MRNAVRIRHGIHGINKLLRTGRRRVATVFILTASHKRCNVVSVTGSLKRGRKARQLGGCRSLRCGQEARRVQQVAEYHQNAACVCEARRLVGGDFGRKIRVDGLVHATMPAREEGRGEKGEEEVGGGGERTGSRQGQPVTQRT